MDEPITAESWVKRGNIYMLECKNLEAYDFLQNIRSFFYENGGEDADFGRMLDNVIAAMLQEPTDIQSNVKIYLMKPKKATYCISIGKGESTMCVIFQPDKPNKSEIYWQRKKSWINYFTETAYKGYEGLQSAVKNIYTAVNSVKMLNGIFKCWGF